MMNKNTMDVIISAVEQYDYAVKSRMGVTMKRTELTNILLSFAHEIVDTIRDADDLMNQLMSAQKKLAQLEKEAAEGKPNNEEVKSKPSKQKASE